jgi:hypothetical protein
MYNNETTIEGLHKTAIHRCFLGKF